MKKLMVSGLVLGLVAFAGCNTSPTGGGGAAGGTFKLKAPVMTTKLNKGESKPVEVTLDRGKDFKEDVALTATVDPADKGVTAEVSPKDVKKSDPAKADVKVTATEKASHGDFNVTVTGKPAKGDSTSVTFKVNVPEAK
jgi:uncharacterized membrane protein